MMASVRDTGSKTKKGATDIMLDAFVDAIKEGSISLVQQYLSQGIAFKDWRDGEDNTCLHLAVKHPSKLSPDPMPTIAVMLLNAGADIFAKNETGQTAMRLAGHRGSWACVIAMAQTRSTDVKDEAQYGSAYLDAARADNLIAMQYLRAAGAIDQWASEQANNFSSLHWGVQHNNADMVEFCLTTPNINPYRLSNENKTPAHMAYSLGHWRCFTTLASRAYLPLINNVERLYPIEHLALNEKEIIYHYVVSLSDLDTKWRAIENALNKTTWLGKVNYFKRGMFKPSTDSGVLKLYEELKKKMIEDGYRPPLPTEDAPIVRMTRPIAISGERERPVTLSAVTQGVSPGWVMMGSYPPTATLFVPVPIMAAPSHLSVSTSPTSVPMTMFAAPPPYNATQGRVRSKSFSSTQALPVPSAPPEDRQRSSSEGAMQKAPKC